MDGKNIGHIPLSDEAADANKIDELAEQTGYTIGWGIAYE